MPRKATESRSSRDIRGTVSRSSPHQLLIEAYSRPPSANSGGPRRNDIVACGLGGRRTDVRATGLSAPNSPYVASLTPIPLRRLVRAGAGDVTNCASGERITTGEAVQRDELLTVDQVLDELAVARRTFTRWRSLGRAPRCIRLPNGELRVWRSELVSWLRSRTEDVA
jgi:predicted DNA-binding transcriptional regulator AlpA